MNLTRNRLVEGCVAASDGVDAAHFWNAQSKAKPPRHRFAVALLAAALAAVVPSLARAQTFTPSAIQQAYGLNLLGPSYTGAGQTIALIEVGGCLGTGAQSNLYTDANGFDTKFGVAPLTAGTNLTIMNQTGDTTPANLPAYDSGWTEETTLDVEYAHALAPGAKIQVIEASETGDVATNVYVAAAYAASHGASVISMSLNITPEDNTSDPYFASGQTAGTVFVAATGDSGATGNVSTPASDPYVVAVGGTTLKVNTDGSYKTETAWSGSGGGVSGYELRPAYQANVPTDLTVHANRTIPDVAFDANPATSGVEIYYDGGTLTGIGGTSLGAPCWAALFALADQQLATANEPLLSSLSALEAMYATYGTAAYSHAFHDIVGGTNGYHATVGYDEATGLGTPIADELVPYLGGQLTLAQLPEPTGAVVILVGLLMMTRRRVKRR